MQHYNYQCLLQLDLACNLTMTHKNDILNTRAKSQDYVSNSIGVPTIGNNGIDGYSFY